MSLFLSILFFSYAHAGELDCASSLIRAHRLEEKFSTTFASTKHVMYEKETNVLYLESKTDFNLLYLSTEKGLFAVKKSGFKFSPNLVHSFYFKINGIEGLDNLYVSQTIGLGSNSLKSYPPSKMKEESKKKFKLQFTAEVITPNDDVRAVYKNAFEGLYLKLDSLLNDDYMRSLGEFLNFKQPYDETAVKNAKENCSNIF
ncbi:MAG: hypothetical protein M9962_04180 [Oligoflexia bacterium]|nr:hypothetical protein [Oligoflexia bacterium]